jgi:hypothetical protein
VVARGLSCTAKVAARRVVTVYGEILSVIPQYAPLLHGRDQMHIVPASTEQYSSSKTDYTVKPSQGAVMPVVIFRGRLCIFRRRGRMARGKDWVFSEGDRPEGRMPTQYADHGNALACALGEYLFNSRPSESAQRRPADLVLKKLLIKALRLRCLDRRFWSGQQGSADIGPAKASDKSPVWCRMGR